MRKVQILQKRVLKMASELIDKEKKIRDTEKLYMNLREILSKHPGPHVTIALNKTQKALRERGQKTKVSKHRRESIVECIEFYSRKVLI